MLGLRAVDSHSGAELGLLRAIARLSIVGVPSYAVKGLMSRSKTGRHAEQHAQRLQEIEPQIEALRAEHKGDQAALNTAIERLYQDSGIKPFASCGPALTQGALIALLGLVTRRLRDRLTGTTLIVEARNASRFHNKRRRPLLRRLS